MDVEDIGWYALSDNCWLLEGTVIMHVDLRLNMHDAYIRHIVFAYLQLVSLLVFGSMLKLDL